MEIYYTALAKEELKKLIQIAERHGSTVKELLFMDLDPLEEQPTCEVDAKLLGKFFENFPNLQEWIIEPVSADAYSGYEDKIIFREFGQPNLKLKTLSLPADSYDAMYDIYRDRNGFYLNLKFGSFVAHDTLTNFAIEGGMRHFKEFLRFQSSLKSISIKTSEEYDTFRDIMQHACCYEHMKLEEFYYEDDYPEDRSKMINFLVQLVRDHPTLRILVTDYNSEEKVLEAICQNSHQLQFLDVELTNENIVTFTGIKNLKQLEELEITFSKEFSRFNVFMEVTELDMPSIKKLKIGWESSSNFDLAPALRNMGSHWKNIEELKLDLNCTRLPGIDFILLNFKRLKHTSTFKRKVEFVFRD